MKFIDWFMDSNRYKHFLGGMGIGLLSDDVYCATLSGIGVASALEFKDWQWGGKWDWIDLSMTVLGTALGFGIRCLALAMIF